MAKRYNERERSKKITNVPAIDNNKKKKNKKKRGIFKKVFLFLFVMFILAFFAIAGMVFGVINGAEQLNREDLTYNNLTTFIYDKDGNEFATLYGSENRVLISLPEMSKYLPMAFKAIEDERFDTHCGIDIQRTIYAVVNYISHGGKSSFGASTITQQLVKNVTNDNQDDPLRKIREWVRAIQVESWLSKEEIIEMYLNIIYLGEGSYGVQTASYSYFGKDASQLTLAESAVLAGINHGPSMYNKDKAPEKIKARQKIVLDKMLELTWISQEEYEKAINQELVYDSVSVDKSSSYISEAVIDKVIEDLVKELKVTKAVASKMVYGDGLKIYTNIDPKVQSALEEVYKDEKYFPLDKSYDERPQSAMVIMDYYTGSVSGLVGGAGDKVLRGLNRATMSTRQPGSTIKPIATYGPALNNKVITAATIYDDVPFSFADWNVSNWDGSYAGLSTPRQGIEKSMNIVAVKILQDLGINNSFTYLQKLGITSLVDQDKTLALTLGGITKGISPFEMTAAYAAIANNGVYLEPILYTRVTDSTGKVLLENKQITRNVFSKESTFILRDMMRDVVTGTNGTAKYINIGGNPVAAKTGSTDSYNDRWFCGFSPYYVAATWYGFDEPKKIHASGQNPAAKIWNAVMLKVHAGLEVKDFAELKSGITKVKICLDSGKLASDLCYLDQRGSRVKEEYFITGTEPNEYCTTHVVKNICKDSNLLLGDDCPQESAESKVFIQRTVILEGTNKAADYIYEAPVEYCNIHMYNPNTEPDSNNENPVEPSLEDEEEDVFNPSPNGII